MALQKNVPNTSTEAEQCLRSEQKHRFVMFDNSDEIEANGCDVLALDNVNVSTTIVLLMYHVQRFQLHIHVE